MTLPRKLKKVNGTSWHTANQSEPTGFEEGDKWQNGQHPPLSHCQTEMFAKYGNHDIDVNGGRG
jgi:hypothetical protein